jgi:hypothetical protein
MGNMGCVGGDGRNSYNQDIISPPLLLHDNGLVVTEKKK